ncbi:MAG: alpha/beta fold hydrolase [Micromonosporaceae bacterium]
MGDRRNHYTTADTVADLDALRRALGVDTWGIDGISYGTYVAQQYALTHPEHTERLVLDSVVTQHNADPMYVDTLAHSATVLRTACREQSCPSDPAKDLAVTLRRYGDGVLALNALIVLSIIDPKLENPNFAALDRLRKAAEGDPAPWREMLGWFEDGDGSQKEMFSAGLHLAALCADFPEMPWGDSSAPPAGREDAVVSSKAGEPSEWMR